MYTVFKWLDSKLFIVGASILFHGFVFETAFASPKNSNNYKINCNKDPLALQTAVATNSVNPAFFTVVGSCLGPLAIAHRTVTFQGKSHAVITNQGTNSTEPVVKITNSNVTIQGMLITGGNSLDGGGIYSENSSLLLENSSVSGNAASRGGGGIFAVGSGIPFVQPSILHLQHTIVSENHANDGGGLYSFGPQTTIDESYIQGNTSINNGGGINISTTHVTLTRSFVTENEAGNYGGGIYGSYAILSLDDNSLVSENTAAIHGGGAYFIYTVPHNVEWQSFTDNDPDDYCLDDGVGSVNCTPN